MLQWCRRRHLNLAEKNQLVLKLGSSQWIPLERRSLKTKQSNQRPSWEWLFLFVPLSRPPYYQRIFWIPCATPPAASGMYVSNVVCAVSIFLTIGYAVPKFSISIAAVVGRNIFRIRLHSSLSPFLSSIVNVPNIVRNMLRTAAIETIKITYYTPENKLY